MGILTMMKTLALFLFLLSSSSATAPAEDQPTPEQRFRQHSRDYNIVSREITRSTTVEDRKAVARRFDEFAKKFLDIADKHPRIPSRSRRFVLPSSPSSRRIHAP